MISKFEAYYMSDGYGDNYLRLNNEWYEQFCGNFIELDFSDEVLERHFQEWKSSTSTN